MIEWFTNLWEKNKILFFLLLPLCIIAVGIKIYLEFNKNRSFDSMKDAEEKDREIAKEIKDIKDKSDQEIEKIEEIEKRIEDRNANKDLDLDWHLKD